MKKRKIAIIGGGASGMMAAIFAAQKGAEVTIYERNDRIGKKLLVTGNGKCNFSNLVLNDSCYRGGGQEKVKAVLERFSSKDCMNFFIDRGMLVKNKNGYLYPASEQSSTVLDILRNQISFLGISLVTECEIIDVIHKNNNRYNRYSLLGIHAGKKEYYDADCVIFSAGSFAGVSAKKKSNGNAYEILKRLDLPLVPVVPALVQLRCKEEYMKSIAGVRLDGEVVLYIDEQEVCRERGEVQLTDYGISGIPVFQLSRYASYALRENQRVTVKLNCLPDFAENEYEKFCKNRKIQNSEQTAEEFFLGICNKKLLSLFMRLAQIKPTEKIIHISMLQKQKMFALLRDLRLTIIATNSFEQAQICAGGLSMDAVNENLEVKALPGVYVVGELLDVDGRCGGYNLQWAFASGMVAGCNAAEG